MLALEATFDFDVFDPVVDTLIDGVEVVAMGAITVGDDVDGFICGTVEVMCVLGIDADEKVVWSMVGTTVSRNRFVGLRLYTHVLVGPARGRCASTGLRDFPRHPCLLYDMQDLYLYLTNSKGEPYF